MEKINETKTKNFWLKLLYWAPVLCIAYMLYTEHLNNIAYSSPYYKSYLKPLISSMQGGYCFGVLWNLISIPIFYHCAIKKRGTALLSCSIFFTYAGFVFLLYSTIFGDVKSAFLFLSSLTPLFLLKLMVLLLLSYSYTVVWVIACHKLRKLNFNLQYQEAIKDENTKKRFEQLDNFTAEEELTQYYSQVIQDYPNLEKILTRRYKIKKKQLK